MARRPTAYDRAKEFFDRLKRDGAWSPVFVVYGEERFLVDEAVQRLVSAVFPSGRDDFNFAAYHGSEVKGADVAAAAAQVPMFASQRVVLLRGADRLSAAEMEPVARYAEDPFDSTLLILEAVKLDGRQKHTKRLLKAKGVHAIEMGALYPNQAADWLYRQAKRHELTLARDVGGYLVDAIGPSLGQLDMALERIDLYLGGEKNVTLADAQAVVPDTRSRSVFELTDHLSARRLDAAIGCFHRMMEQGESPIGALAMIARQFRQLLLVKDGTTRGLQGRDLSSHVGCPPFKLRDYEAAARGFTEARLRALLQAIAAADLASKSARLKRELIVERLFVQICSA